MSNHRTNHSYRSDLAKADHATVATRATHLSTMAMGKSLRYESEKAESHGRSRPAHEEGKLEKESQRSLRMDL